MESHSVTHALENLRKGVDVSEAAARQLDRSYSERLRRIARKICGVDGDELANDALFDGVTGVVDGAFRWPEPDSGTRPRDAFWGFLRLLLQRKRIDWWRKAHAKKRPRVEDKARLDAVKDGAERPDTQAEEKDLLQFLLAQLPAAEQLREIVVRRFYEGYSAEEIARIICVSPAGMYRRLVRIRNILKPYLQ